LAGATGPIGEPWPDIPCSAEAALRFSVGERRRVRTRLNRETTAPTKQKTGTIGVSEPNTVDESAANVIDAGAATPWQLKMFSKSLKKRQKLSLLLRQLRGLPGGRFLLITNGDNNGALNYHLRASGGEWTWVENEADSIPEIEDLLNDKVLAGTPSHIPVEDESFDVVVSIDVHEHLVEPHEFNRELRRVTRPGGHVIVTTPNGDTWKPVTLLKRGVGMTKEKYGHVVYGYNVRQHREMLSGVGFEPVSAGSYSRFFTEMIELAINFAYVMVLSWKKTGARAGEIAPSNREKLRAVEKQYRLYAAVYPVLLAISKLDLLLSFFTGYAVSVVARRPE
jgi:SAM-dependent methyltransferase